MRNSTQIHASLLSQSDYKTMHWKNGRGFTNQIAIFPSNAAFPEDPFLWRLSSAQVTETGPFSEFPGYDRDLALIKGKGLKISEGENESSILIKSGDVRRFAGEQKIFAEPLMGPVTDLNLIFSRSQVKSRFEILQFSNKPRSFQVEGKEAFIFGIFGSLTASLFPGEVKFQIREGETLRIELGKSSEVNEFILLEPKKPGSSVCLIELSWT
jgi:uncharacterized protein